MMKITVRLFGEYRAWLGVHQLDLRLPEGATVGDALNAVWTGQGNGDSAGSNTNTENATRMDPVVLVNGRNVEILDGEARILSDGDRIVVTPLLGGG